MGACTYHQKYLRFKYVCHLNPGVNVMLEKVEKLSCDSVHLLTELHNYIYVFFFVYIQTAWRMDHYCKVENVIQVSNAIYQER